MSSAYYLEQCSYTVVHTKLNMKDKLKLSTDLKKNLFYKLLAPANPKSRTASFGLP